MRILWIEDERAVLEDQAHLFGAWNGLHDIQAVDNYDEARLRINRLRDYDLAVFDIDLRHSAITPLIQDTAATFGLQAREFLKSAGFHLYIHAAKQGFPEERMVFLTGNMGAVTAETAAINALHTAYDSEEDAAWNNAIHKLQNLMADDDARRFDAALESGDEEKMFGWLAQWSGQPPHDDTYDDFSRRFRHSLLEPPQSIDKKSADGGAAALQNWLKQHCSPQPGKRETFDYLTLRRGILDVVNEIKNDNKIQFTADFKDDLDKETFISGLAWQVRDFALPAQDYAKSYLAVCDYLSKPFDGYSWGGGPRSTNNTPLLQAQERHLKIPLYFLRNWIAHGLISGSATKMTAQAAGLAFLIAIQHFFAIETYGFQDELKRLFKPVDDEEKWKQLCIASGRKLGAVGADTALEKLKSFGFKTTTGWQQQNFIQNFYAAYLLCLQQADGTVTYSPFNALAAGEMQP